MTQHFFILGFRPVTRKIFHLQLWTFADLPCFFSFIFDLIHWLSLLKIGERVMRNRKKSLKRTVSFYSFFFASLFFPPFALNFRTSFVQWLRQEDDADDDEREQFIVLFLKLLSFFFLSTFPSRTETTKVKFVFHSLKCSTRHQQSSRIKSRAQFIIITSTLSKRNHQKINQINVNTKFYVLIKHFFWPIFPVLLSAS